MTTTHEAWVSDTILLTFDGTVLELFGFSDTHRIHIAYRPEIHFEDERRPRLKIEFAGRQHTMDYDPARREGLDRLVEQIRATYRPR